MSHHGSDMSSTGDDHSGHDHFCNGDGTVMLQGFQMATSASVNCVLFLFEDAAVDSATKYIFAVLGAFILGLTNEIIRYSRGMLAQRKLPAHDLMMTGGFAVQMLFAYALMLLVMLYEYVILIAVILGLSTGHFITLRLNRANQEATRAMGGKRAVTAYPAGNSSAPCCSNDVNA